MIWLTETVPAPRSSATVRATKYYKSQTFYIDNFAKPHKEKFLSFNLS